jgi:hypothetical protein
MNDQELKKLCNTFDTTYELEGGKLKQVVTNLMPKLEKAYIDSIADNESLMATWFAWMYGKVAHDEGSEEILAEYKKVKTTRDEYLKVVSAKYKLTNLFDIIKLDGELI